MMTRQTNRVAWALAAVLIGGGPLLARLATDPALRARYRGRGADLHGALLAGASLQGADLREANLEGALLVRTDLEDADLSGADLRKANLSGASLYHARVH